MDLEERILKEQMTSKVSHNKKGINFLTAGFLAVVFSVFGIIIASNFDLTPKSLAEVPVKVAQLSTKQVVQNADGEMESPFVSVVEQYKDAVVNISVRLKPTQSPWWKKHAQGGNSSGSGFVFREDGYILTNNHVVEKAESIEVRTSSGYVYDAQLVGGDSETDLAVLKIEPQEKLTVIPFGDSDALKVGDWAIAIGNPFPQQGLDRTVTVGVISAKGRSNLYFGPDSPGYQNYIQTDASINPGNSGGPLLNIRGECIGVNAAISSPTGTSVGIGFAIPINFARAIVPDLIETGKAHRGWLGVSLRALNQKEANRQGLDAVKGVLIDNVFDNSPAKSAGIRKGDVVIEFNNKKVESVNDLRILVSTIKSGNKVPLEIVREGKHINLTVSVVDRDAFFAAQSNSPLPETDRDDFDVSQWMGMEVMPFTKELAELINADFVKGMYVRRVLPDSPADKASILRKTIILQVNNKPVKNLDDFINITGQITNMKKRIPLIVQEPDGTIVRKIIIGYNR